MERTKKATQQQPAMPALLPITVDDLVSRIVERVLAELAAQPKTPALRKRKQIAHELQVCEKTVARLEADGLPVVHIAGSPRYCLADVLEHLKGKP